MGVTQVLQECSKSLPPSQAILLYLTVVLEGERAPQILQYLPASEWERIAPHFEKIRALPAYDRKFSLLDEVRRLSHPPTYRGLDEMDGSWILHFLRREKPAVIALILKHLPADKVYQILNQMNPVLRAKLPDAQTLEQVPPEILHVVRKKFEDQLRQFQPPSKITPLDFQCLRNLSGKDLFTLVRDLGLEQLAIGFQGVSERSLIELVKNLDEEDAEELFEKFRKRQKVSRAEIKASQLQILGLSLDFSTAAELILEAGVERLARCLLHQDEDFIAALQYKLPFKSGYQLKRYVDDLKNSRRNETDLLSSSRKDQEDFVLQRVKDLSRAGHVTSALSALRPLAPPS